MPDFFDLPPLDLLCLGAGPASGTLKMQNEIQAPVGGTVTEIHCEEGQSIEANVPLLVITPPETEEED